jgi:4-oxalocrotonate tautomerase
MPMIHIRAMEGAWSKKQRKALVNRITEAVVAVQGEGLRAATWVLWDDIKSGQLTIGGIERTTAIVRAAALGKPVGRTKKKTR